MSTPPLLIENLSFRYRSRSELALKDVNLRVEAGQVLLIAGASGCGKTTLARCINGLIPRSYKGELTGRILIQGQEIRSLSLARISQLIGTVLQDPERQILGTKVLNEVAFGLENLSLSRDEILERADAAMQRLKISHLRLRETFHLSGGEKQKVALAGVLAMQPSLLMLDEPLASLDPASAEETLAIVRQLADDGMTILLIEHRVEDVLRIHPEQTIYMTGGQIRYFGPTAGLEEVVDYHEIKLPAEKVIERAARSKPTPPTAPRLTGRDPSAPPIVRFENVSFGYEAERSVLQGINLGIGRGEIIAILGPNGAGKTTLVKHAIGLLKPQSGHVWIDEQDTHTLSVAQIASQLGYVFQSPSHMLFAPTVREELAFGPANLRHKPQAITQQVQQALEIVNMQGMEETPPLSLSFGQQKRISIAAILAMRSRILVMDEPTAGQDYRNYMQFMDAIVQMPNFDAILFITHDVDMAVIYANRVLLVNQGQVVADGSPAEVLGDFDRLRANRVIPTSLLHANLQRRAPSQSFKRAEELALETS